MFAMQHVDLCVQNLSLKFHEILKENQKVLVSNRVNMNGLLETGSVTSGDDEGLVTWHYLLLSKNNNTFLLPSTVFFFKTLDQSLSRKKRTMTRFLLVSEKMGGLFDLS